MDKKAIFDLRKKEIIEFHQIKEMGLFLENLVGKERIIPAVIGHEGFPEDWVIENLNPLTNLDKLTIDSYLEAINCLKSGKDFQGRILFRGVDSFNHFNLDYSVLLAYISERGSTGRAQTFNIDVCFSQDKSSDSTGYIAVSKITPTLLEQAFSGFDGPKREYKRVLM